MRVCVCAYEGVCWHACQLGVVAGVASQTLTKRHAMLPVPCQCSTAGYHTLLLSFPLGSLEGMDAMQ